MSSSTSIKVILPLGCSEKIKAYKFKNSYTVQKALSKVIKDLQLKNSGSWAFYQPQTKEQGGCGWFDSSAILVSFPNFNPKVRF